jgi:signal transduction histidine kinase
MRVHKICFCLLFVSNYIWAQATYQLMQYTQANGLPQNSINSLCFTPGGFLWLATESGIARFNGETFKTFNRYNFSQISDDRIKFIIPDINGNLYAQASKGEVFSIKENKLEFVSNASYSHVIKGMIPDVKMLTDTHTRKQFISLQNRLALFPVFIVSTHQNQYSLLGRKYLYTIKQNSRIDSCLIDIKPQAYFGVNGNEYILATNNQLYRVAQKMPLPQLIPVFLFPNSKTPTKIIYKHNTGKVYAIQGKVLSEIVFKDADQIETIPLLQNLPENDLISDVDVFQEIIAVGTLSNGLYLYKKVSFETLLPSENLNASIKPYYAIDVDSKGNIFSASGHVFGQNSFTTINLNNGWASPEVIKIIHDTSIFFSFADSIFVHNPHKKTSKLIYSVGSKEIITSLTVQSDKVYLATSKIVTVLNADTVFRSYTFGQKIKERINYIHVAPNSKIYAGGCDGLFVSDSLSGKMLQVSPHSDFCVRYITQLQDLLVVCTYGNGIWVMSQNKWFKLPSDYFNSIAKSHALVCDAKNRIWISTNNGLIQTTLDGINNYVNDSTFRISYRRFDQQEGIFNSEFNGGCQPAFVYDHLGRIAFPSMYGIIRFHPDSLLKADNLKMYIDNIIVDGKQITLQDALLNIPSKSPNFTLELTWPSWGNTGNITTKYALENHDAMPKFAVGSVVSMPYSNLSGGKYVLTANLLKPGFGSITDTLHLEINVAYTFYETLWFRLLLILGISLIIYLLLQTYTYYLRRQNQHLENQVANRTAELDKVNQTLQTYNQQLIASEKELKQSISVKNRLISIITHDIITPLRFIAMVARNTESDIKREELLSTLGDIHHTSIRLHDNAQNILNWIKHQSSQVAVNPTNVALFAIIEQITDLLKEQSDAVNVKILNLIELDKIIVTDRNILSIILHNILSNAVKYTRDTQVKILSTDESNYTTIVIADNGNGIQTAMLSRINKVMKREQSYFLEDTSGGHGLGFIIVSELSQLIGATVEIQSSSNGTTVIFKIPLTN